MQKKFIILRGTLTYFYLFLKFLFARTMVLVLDGNSDIGAHVRAISCYLVCIRPLISPRAVIGRTLHACVTCYELGSNISTMARTKKGNGSINSCTRPTQRKSTFFSKVKQINRPNFRMQFKNQHVKCIMLLTRFKLSKMSTLMR